MTILEQSKPADEARDSVLRSGAVSSCNDLLAPIHARSFACWITGSAFDYADGEIWPEPRFMTVRMWAALLRKMQGKPEAVETAKAQGQFAPCPGSVAAGICLHCDYWTLRSTDGTGGMQGWCDLFVKRTPANHGRKCTGWTPREPLNAGTQRGRDAEATNATETRTRPSLK